MGSKQIDLFDPVEGERRRDRSVEQVDANASYRWKLACMFAIRTCAEHLETFTTDDVWARIPRSYKTHEHRAMGACMTAASDGKHGILGWITPTDEHVLTRRPEAHRRPIRVWRSLIREEPF